MSDVLNLFPARIAIGKWRDPDTGKDVPVLMSSEFERALGALFRRVGGSIAFSNDDIAILTAGVDGAAAVANAESRVAQLEQQILALQAQVAALAQVNKHLDDMDHGTIYGAQAAVGQQAKRLSDLEVMSMAVPVNYMDWTRPGKIGSGTPNTAAFTSVTYSGQLTSTVATGTAPMVVSSTTKVANLNVDLLDGADWAAPLAIGSTTPNTAVFTTVLANTSSSGSATKAIFLLDNTGNYAFGVGPTGSEGFINYHSGTAGTASFGHRFLVNGTARLTIDGTNQTTANGALRVNGNLGVFNTAPVAKQTVTGSRAANAALASLLTALATYGLVTDSSTV